MPPELPPPIRLLLGGAVKSGTTALHRYLAEHPSVCSHAQREMPYFARDEEFDRGYGWAFERYFAGECGDHRAIIANHAMARYSPRAIERAAAHSSDTQLVLVLRNPVDRAYSHYWYARTRGWESAGTFEEALACGATVADGEPRHGSQLAYVDDGIYEPHVRRAIDAFGPERTSVHLSSDLRGDTRAVLRGLFERIGVDPACEVDTNVAHNRTARARSERLARMFLHIQQPGHPVRRAASRLVPCPLLYRARYRVHRLNERPGVIPEIEPATRERLVAHYAPHNQALGELIGRDLESWNR